MDLFVVINSKQKPVSRNLLTTIISGLFWNSEKSPTAFQALKSRLLVMLGEKDDSPLYKRIMVGDKSKSTTACVTLDTILKVGLNKTEFFAKHNKGKIVSMGYLWVDPTIDGEIDYEPMLNKSYDYFRDVLDHVKSHNESVWDLGSAPGGYLSMNIGVLCVIRLADNIVKFLKESAGIDPTKKSGEDLAMLTNEYLEPVNAFFKGLDAEKVNQIRKQSASAAGVENVIRELQKVIRDRFNDFNPVGLDQWVKDNSGRYNVFSKAFVEVVEIKIRDTIFAELQKIHGDKWWRDGVKTEIQKAAAAERIEQKSEEPDHNFLYLSDYRSIIADKWGELFKGIFMDPEFPTGKKDDQLKWFARLIAVRNKVSHPTRAKVSKEEFDAMVKLNDWLPGRIGMMPVHTGV